MTDDYGLSPEVRALLGAAGEVAYTEPTEVLLAMIAANLGTIAERLGTIAAVIEGQFE